jgi:hypothetical protein
VAVHCDRTRRRSPELGDQERGAVVVFGVLVAGVDEVDLVALGLELLLEQEAEHGGVGRVLLRRALDGGLVLGRVIEEDRRVDSRATGSALSGLAMSSWKASQSDEQPPVDPPVAATRALSMPHSRAFDRGNCTALAAPSSGRFTSGVTPASRACVTRR